MLVLVHNAPGTLLREYGKHPNLGILMCPARIYTDAPGTFPWAADNRAFTDWDEEKYRAMLDRITGWPGCLFVSAPDVVGDAATTFERFYEWQPELRKRGLPVAFVAQDGLIEPPWDEFDAFFIGGTTEFKLGFGTAYLIREAKERGKWVHMGRVNSKRRMRYAQSLGCDSIDGTKFSMFSKEGGKRDSKRNRSRQDNVLWALEMNRGGEQASLLFDQDEQ